MAISQQLIHMNWKCWLVKQNIEKLMKQVNGSVTGHSGWGSYQFHDYQTYGTGAYDWSSVMTMAEHGQGSGALGQTIHGINDQFPADSSIYNRGVSDRNSQKYYAIKSQTVLAVRAASQLGLQQDSRSNCLSAYASTAD